MRDALLLVLAMGGCMLGHLLMHKAMIGKCGHNHDHHNSDHQKISQCKEHQVNQNIKNDELVALDEGRSKTKVIEQRK